MNNRDSDPIIYGIEHSDKAHATPYPDGVTHFVPDGSGNTHPGWFDVCQECHPGDDKTPFGATLTNTSTPLARKLAPMLSDFEKATDALTPEDFG